MGIHTMDNTSHVIIGKYCYYPWLEDWVHALYNHFPCHQLSWLTSMIIHHIPNTDWEWVTETANEPELTKKTLENSIFHLLEAFHHIFHDGTCKIKTLITEERGELAHMMIIFITILLFLRSSLYQYLRSHLNYCTPWFTRWLVNSLAIKLPTFLSWVCLSWWLFPFLATLILLFPSSTLCMLTACKEEQAGWNIWDIVRFLQVLLLCKVLYEMFLVYFP